MGVIVKFNGQTPLNIARELAYAGVTILGTSVDAIDLAEDRDRFRKVMEQMKMLMPESGMASSLEEARMVANRIGYPLMVWPSYVRGGRGVKVIHDIEMRERYVLAAVDVTPERPILIDRFLDNAQEMEADALSDDSEAFVPAVMDHIELAGIHSGDSTCAILPVNIPPRHLKTIKEYTQRIAEELHVVGLMNMQYALAGDMVYVLEAKIPYFEVKGSVFPFNMFPDVDPISGPEMRSNREVLGLVDFFGMAFYKAEEAAKQTLPENGTVLITVAGKDRPGVLNVARGRSQLGFEIMATKGTNEFLAGNSVKTDLILKLHEGRHNIDDAIKNWQIRLVINTLIGKAIQYDDSYIRKAAIKYKVPYITTIAAASAAAKGIAAFQKGRSGGKIASGASRRYQVKWD